MKSGIRKILVVTLALALCFSMMLPAYAAAPEAETKAAALKQLGLFMGVSDTDFALDRAPTRVEALVMLLRTLGVEDDAKASTATHPFTDVPGWADSYIAYAYENGFTKGVSDTSFGSGDADSDMYLTFMLRALGYSDTDGDFVWNTPDTLAKAGSQSLADKLMADGAFTNEALEAATASVGETKPVPVSVSSLDKLQEALQTAKVINVDTSGTPLVITGELTIPQGVTVVVNRGSDFYIEGTLTNNGTIKVMGADAVVSADFINYSVMAVRNGGKVINNGALALEASILADDVDRGPVGGQLRIFEGEFQNNGSVFLKKGDMNTKGGMLAVIEGTFTNDGTVIADGFQIDIASSFVNNAGAVVINNSYVSTEKGGSFTGDGKLTGFPIVE